MAKVTIEFDNQGAARDFADWLSEAGEQYYFEWSETQISENKNLVPANDFEYTKLSTSSILVKAKHT